MITFEEPKITVLEYEIEDIVLTSGPDDENAGEEDEF